MGKGEKVMRGFKKGKEELPPFAVRGKMASPLADVKRKRKKGSARTQAAAFGRY
jgi:hypothetical protein